jgi:two-component system chemotaxis sensor kinase CheA
MTAPDHPFAALLADYVAECLPLAEDVLERSLALERAWAGGEEAADLYGPLQGLLHTIKGNSAMMGLRPAQELAHALEDLAESLATGPARRRDGVEVLVRGTGLLADLVRSAAIGDSPDSAHYLEELRRFLDQTVDLPAEPARVERRGGDRREDADRMVTTVRVESHRLDALLEALGETMIAQAGLRDAVKRVTRGRRGTPEESGLDQAVLALGRTLQQLEQDLMETRLLPIATVFGRFTRLVRDLARGEGKEVRLEAAGGDTRLDKTVIDRMGEPLVHLVTNAIIHGIEPPEQRVELGKPAEAVITLRAAQRGDRVVLTVSDDGRGLDPAKLLHKARALGHAPASGTPALEEIYGFAFLPGLSTAERVSSLSGRGVGLDVVGLSIRSLGGQVSVTSEPGRGTTFTLRLPLTVAVLRSLLVEVDKERYAVPLADIAETLRMGPDVLRQAITQGTLIWRDQVIPVIDASHVLGLEVPWGVRACPDARTEGRRYCVVLKAATHHRGLLVDSLLGHQEVVVKALDPTLGRPETIAATTILGDGRVACILDAAGIADGAIEARGCG